jgi:hypothetical protein
MQILETKHKVEIEKLELLKKISMVALRLTCATFNSH